MICNQCGYPNDDDEIFCAKCGSCLQEEVQKKPSTSWIDDVNPAALVAAVMVAAVLVFAAFRFLPQLKKTVAEAKPQSKPQAQVQVQDRPQAQTQPQTQQNAAWKDNVLIRERIAEVIPLNGYRSSIGLNYVFGNDSLIRSDICRVVFEDTVAGAPKDHWDASADKNGSVLAWTVPAGNDLYELHLAAEGGINGRIACEDLFCGYNNLTQIDFNGSFHTEEAEDMSRMFYGCLNLRQVDLSEISTNSAINFSEMFANCFALERLDLSRFNTSYVEDVSGMFNSCWNLKSLNISNFDLFRVRDVSYMFYQCPAGNGVVLPGDSFLFRNVDRYSNFMDEGVLVLGRPWEDLFFSKEIEVKPGVFVGNTVTYGSYEQDDNYANGREPVQWTVLDVQGDKALLVSRYALDSQPYHNITVPVTWEDSSIRQWLNGEFMYTAFTEQERSKILVTDVDNSSAQNNPEWQTSGGANTRDLVFLLSYSEVSTYMGTEARICVPTLYAESVGADTRLVDEYTGAVAGWWWLRSPGEEGNHACFVNFAGKMYSNMVSNGYLSVRPAIWVSLDAL